MRGDGSVRVDRRSLVATSPPFVPWHEFALAAWHEPTVIERVEVTPDGRCVHKVTFFDDYLIQLVRRGGAYYLMMQKLTNP